MKWLELTALDESKTLVCLDRVDWISTGYDQPGCVIHFFGGTTRSVVEDVDTIKLSIVKAIGMNGDEQRTN